MGRVAGASPDKLLERLSDAMVVGIPQGLLGRWALRLIEGVDRLHPRVDEEYPARRSPGLPGDACSELCRDPAPPEARDI